MADRVISVKMPGSLIEALRNLQAEHHYLDLSEQLRSIVREKCLEFTNPYLKEIKRVRKDIASEGQVAREQILKDIIQMLKGGGT